MTGFGAGSIFLQSVSKDTSISFKAYKFIALLLSFPLFRLSQFFFKLAYTLQQRELLRISSECARLRGEYYRLQFDGLSVDVGGSLEFYHRLRYISSRLETANCRGN